MPLIAHANTPQIVSATTGARLTGLFPRTAPQSLKAATLDGQAVDLAKKPGWKVIYFWSPSCPCVSACEEYSFLPLERKYRGKVSFYGVVSGQYDLQRDSRELSTEIRRRHLPYSVLLDPAHDVVRNLNGRVTPQTFVLDPQNRVVFAGMPDDSRRYIKAGKSEGVQRTFLSDALAEALSGKPVAEPTNTLEGCIVAW